MFNTSGYFKGLTCPYFSGGLCERPYCHFRHVKPATEEKTGDGCVSGTDAGTGSKPSLLNMVGDAIRQVQRDIEKDKARLSTVPTAGPVVYNPTPLAHCSSAPKVPVQRENVLKRVTIPQYNPTPIRLLKKQQAIQQKRSHSELEYDPATNFSTSGNGTIAKKTTITGEPKEKYLKKVESNDSEIEATFSDEDEDDATVSSTALDVAAGKKVKKEPEACEAKSSKTSDKTANASPKGDPVVKVKEEPLDDKKSTEKKDTDKDGKNIFDLVRVKNEKCDESVSVKSKKSEKEKVAVKVEKTSSSSDDNKASSHKNHKKSESSYKRSHSSEKGKSSSKERHSSDSKSHSQDKKKHSPGDNKKSEGSGTNKDKSSSSKHKSSRSHHRSLSSSSSHKDSSHRKHRISTSSQESGSKSNREQSSGDKHRKRHERKESTDSHGSGRSKLLSTALFGGDSDEDVVVLSDNEQKEVVELSSEEEVLDLEALFDDAESGKSHSPEKPEEDEATEVQVVRKKRVAHAAASGNTATQKRCALELPKARPSPAEVLYNRMREMKRRAEEQAQKVQEGKVSSTSSIGSERKRLALSPSAANKRISLADSSTQSKTVNKGEKRVAHMPSKAALVRPIIPADRNSKVPVNVRQRYLNTFIDECLKIYPSETDAFDRGQEEEKQIYSRSGTKVVYLNNAVNTIKKLRTEARGGTSSSNISPIAKVKIEMDSFNSPKKGSPKKPGTPSPKKQTITSHELVLGGKKGFQSNFTVKRSGKHAPVPDKFTGAQLYKHLQPYILTEEQLFDNGFPRPDPESHGSAIVNVLNDSDKIASKVNERICCRCGKRFMITEIGKCVIQEPCVHHWGKAFKRKIAGQWDHRYTCCQSDLSGKGCQIGTRHVHDQNKYDDLNGFRQTKPCATRSDGNYGVYALDCEMVYTEGGLELARVTVIDENCEVVLESKVVPDYPVVDYNTRFSGLTEEEMAGETTTLKDIQRKLLKMFNDKSILIGHSLESDLVALKLIHETVVDTSVVFPHKLGPPYKKALRTLMADLMQKIIQNDEDGHDSKEDAVSCMELMLWKVKEDVKKAMRRK